MPPVTNVVGAAGPVGRGGLYAPVQNQTVNVAGPGPAPSFVAGLDQSPFAAAQAGAVRFQCVGLIATAGLLAIAAPAQTFGLHEASVKQASQGASVWGPNHAAQIAPGGQPVPSYVTRAPDDSTQVQPQIEPGAGLTPAPLVSAARPWYFVKSQDDPTQLQAVFVNGLGDTLARPPLVPYQAKPQDDTSQIPAAIRPALGSTLAKPPVRPFAAAPQQDIGQAAPVFSVPPTVIVAYPTLAPEQFWGSHQDAIYNSQARGTIYSVVPATVASVITPARAYVAAGQADPSQPAPVLSFPQFELGVATPLTQAISPEQDSPYQVQPVTISPFGRASQAAAPPPPRAFSVAPQTDLSQPAPVFDTGLGSTLARTPISPFIAAPQQDPTQLAAQLLAPNYAAQIVAAYPTLAPEQLFGAHQDALYNAQARGTIYAVVPVPAVVQAQPLAPYQARPQDDPTQVQPVIALARGFTLAAPVLRPYVAKGQDDPTQIPPQVWAGQESTLLPPPIRSFVAAQQADPSQVPAQIIPALGSTLARPPLVPFVATPQADPTQVPAAWQPPQYASPPVLVTTPAPQMLFASQADPRQIQPVIIAPQYAAPVAPSSGIDLTQTARVSRKNVKFKWGAQDEPVAPKPPKPEKKGKPAPRAPAAPSPLLLKMFGQAGIGDLRAPPQSAPQIIPKTIPEAPARAKDKPWPEPPAPPPPPPDPEKVALEQAAARAVEEAATAVAEAVRLKAEIARVQERMAAIERAMEAELDTAKAAAAAQERRARAAEDETTRQMARRVEEQRLAEEELRRARNNLIAIQAAIQVFFSDDEQG